MVPKELHKSVQFSGLVMSKSLWPHGLQHARLPCPSLSLRACSNSCPSSWWCHLILCRPLLLLPSVLPSIRVFSNESVLRIRWPKYWSFSFTISPSNEYSGLISSRMDWLDRLAPKNARTCFPCVYSEKKVSKSWSLVSNWFRAAAP